MIPILLKCNYPSICTRTKNTIRATYAATSTRIKIIYLVECDLCYIYVAIVCRVPLPNNCAISYIICYAVYLYDPVPVIIPLASIGITIREGKCVYLKNTYHESKNHQNCQKTFFY